MATQMTTTDTDDAEAQARLDAAYRLEQRDIQRRIAKRNALDNLADLLIGEPLAAGAPPLDTAGVLRQLVQAVYALDLKCRALEAQLAGQQGEIDGLQFLAGHDPRLWTEVE